MKVVNKKENRKRFFLYVGSAHGKTGGLSLTYNGGIVISFGASHHVRTQRGTLCMYCTCTFVRF